ncbi:MAG: hypothetical protein JSS87_00280 [Acidobacteria bacterium]|nr:hypothetical protein [Acidobacteriota bacterium]
MHSHRSFFLGFALLMASSLSAATLQNHRYTLTLGKDGAVRMQSAGQTVELRPRFAVVMAETDPKYSRLKDAETAFVVPSWKPDGKTKTADFLQAGHVVTMDATGAELKDGVLHWTFADRPDFALEADLSLPKENADPVIHMQLKAKKAGWFSAGYTGIPATDPKAVDWLWQPLVWQEKRFPSKPFLSTEYMCPVPATFVQVGPATMGLAVDQSEVPFRLPTFQNSRFGVMLRNQDGEAQPMAFAPVFGLPDSHLQVGGTISLKVRPFITKGDWFDAYRHVATDLFGFHDYRQNGPVSLNTTLDNMIDFAMNDTYSGWNAALKGFDYATDVPGTVKLVSALHPLSLAIVRDNPEIYNRRALPMMEYMMSRQKYLFSMSPEIEGQNPSHLMKGPAAEVSELSALYAFSQDRSPVFRYFADLESKTPRHLNLEMVSTGDSFQDLLALYRMTGEQAYLDRAKAKADSYIAERIAKPQTDFSDVHVAAGGQFWTDFSPKWVDLMELYETTHEKRYLDAAATGAKEYMQYVWLQPTVPNDDVFVNKGGKTVIAYHSRLNPSPQPIPSPEQRVPAWRVSQIGLTPEASTTYTPNPAVLLTHYAAYMLRLAEYTGDTFFRDVAHSAVLGRYENFPGYDINGEYTTTYQRADYPLRPWKELTYNEIYYNHVWPHIALLTDYLVSDAITRSRGAVDFPSQYAQAYAYLMSKVYGDRPGTIYGEKDVKLWMPKGLLRTDQVEVNYIAGYNVNTLFLVLTNQSNSPLAARVQLDPNVASITQSAEYKVRVWKDNHAAAQLLMKNGEIVAPLSPRGITVLAIDGVHIVPNFQRRYFDNSASKLSDASYANTTTPVGPVHGMILGMGKDMSTAYIWLEATDETYETAELFVHRGNEWNKAGSTKYPFDFSIPMKDSEEVFEYYVQLIAKDGKITKAEPVTLKR